MFETYFFLFIDSLFSSLVLPIRSEMVFPTMIIVGGYQKSLIFLVAFFASVTGLLINWSIGKLLSPLKNSKAFKGKEEQLSKIENVWNKYLVWLLPIIVLNPVGSVLCLFGGFFRTKFLCILILISIGRLSYYFLNINL